MPTHSASPPRRLAAAVACVAAAMLLVEIVVTRLFSVLFYYHFSFFAISLVMSGLVIGGILASRWDARGAEQGRFERRLSWLGLAFAAATLAALVVVVALPSPERELKPSVGAVLLYATLFLPGLVAAGAFLALAFARNAAWIGRLYAWDLVAAALACAASVWLLRTLQGPPVFLVPVLLGAAGGLALAGRDGRLLAANGALALTAACLAVASLAAGGGFLRLRAPADDLIFERWNEHSRIQARDIGPTARFLVIDKSAATAMPAIPPEPDGAPVRPQEWWTRGAQYVVYKVGRPAGEVAIIGVGGGLDLLPPLARGARVDGYELNRIFVDLLERDFRDFNDVASHPNLTLIHDEARVGITHSGKRYDVIQASLIDTWAATAGGGFVLSENALYTREGWRAFLSRLGDGGILTMTRWYIPDAPAETERLVALAASALADAGVDDARPHVMLVSSGRGPGGTILFTEAEIATMATILVSKAPFTPEEVERVRAACEAERMELLAAPGRPSVDPVVDRLLVSATRDRAIDESVYDISPPTDAQPYFFLQVRPSDLARLSPDRFGSVTEITFRGVRVMLMLAACALGLILVVTLLVARGLPGTSASATDRGVYRLMTVYFLGIGFGYILVQLALHQRLVVALGHPTFALSVVLFSMLLGTGAGAALSSRLFASRPLAHAAAPVLGLLAALLASLPLAPALERVGWIGARLAVIALVLGATGVVLGFAFPLGVRLVAPTGEWAVQKMWATNGAATIAGSVLAACVGITAGSGAVLALGLASYAAAFAAGALAERRAAREPSPALVPVPVAVGSEAEG